MCGVEVPPSKDGGTSSAVRHDEKNNLLLNQVQLKETMIFFRYKVNMYEQIGDDVILQFFHK